MGASGPSLPLTGDSLTPIVGTGGAALIAGVGLLLATRRKPTINRHGMRKE